MAATRIGDVIVPEVFNPYVIERTPELSALFQSGIIMNVEELLAFVSEGGNTIHMPFWQDLSGADEVVSANGGSLSVNAIESGQDEAVVLARGKAWGVNELAAALSGSDPMSAIGDLVAGYWARRLQAAAISILQGVFGELSSTHVHDISEVDEGQKITADATLDALQLLGDAKSRLTGIIMHSAVENQLAKDDLIEYEPASEGDARIPFFLGKRVVVDDGVPVDDGVYDTYLFGPGAIGFANGTSSKVTQTETDRDSLAGEDILINRRHFVLHPRGVAWDGSATGGGPDNDALATAGNWSQEYEDKNIRMVLLRHELANSEISE